MTPGLPLAPCPNEFEREGNNYKKGDRHPGPLAQGGLPLAPCPNEFEREGNNYKKGDLHPEPKAQGGLPLAPCPNEFDREGNNYKKGDLHPEPLAQGGLPLAPCPNEFEREGNNYKKGYRSLFVILRGGEGFKRPFLDRGGIQETLSGQGVGGRPGVIPHQALPDEVSSGGPPQGVRGRPPWAKGPGWRSPSASLSGCIAHNLSRDGG